MPTGWNYGSVLTIETSQNSTLNSSLNLQLAWDVRHNVNNVAGYLWMRTKDEIRGYRSWERLALMSDLNKYLPLSGGWMDYAGQIYFKGLGQSTTVYATIGYRASLGSVMHHTASPHQDNGAFYIGTNGCNSANDWGGLAIDNEGVTVFGAGDTGSVFRVLNEDNVSDGAQFYVTKASGTVSKYTHTISKGLLKVTNNSNTITIGSQNSNWGHIENSANINFYFNRGVYVDGDIWRYNTNYGISSDGYFYAKGMYANRDGSSTNGGLSLYSNSDPMVYGVAFRSIGTYGSHGKVTGDWATYITMTGATNRGWIFRREGTNVFSVSGAGYGEFNGNVSAATVGYSNPGNAALEVREYARAGTDTSIAPHSMMYAPRIGFHWGDRYWANLVYYDNWFRFINSDGSGYAGVVSSGFYHSGYASSAYALTSDGGAAHIGSMSVNYATSAGKLNTNNGTSVKPVYFSGGVPVTCSYEIGCVKAAASTSATNKYLLGVTAAGY
jgi:hypothetical protein